MAAQVECHGDSGGAILVVCPARERGMPSLDVVPIDARNCVHFIAKVPLQGYICPLVTGGAGENAIAQSAGLEFQIRITAHAGDIRAGSDAGMCHCSQLIDEGSSLVCFRDAAAVEENLCVGGEGFFPCGDLRRMSVKGVGIECLFAKPEISIAAVRNDAKNIDLCQSAKCLGDLRNDIAIAVDRNHL